MGNKRNEEIEIDLLEVLRYFMKRFWIILLVTVIFAGGAGGYTKLFMQKMYSSTSKLYILTRSTSITSLADIQIGSQLTVDYIQLVQSRPVVDQVIENLSLNRDYEEVLSQMEFTNPSNSRILVITALDSDPQLAKDLVDEFANVAKVRISTIMKTDEPTVVEYGYISEDAVKPSLKKNVALGGAVGMALTMGVLFVFFLLDDTIKNAEDIERYLGLNTLTVIPLEDGEKASKKKRKAKGGK